jgi:hypothetical protein
MPFVSRLASSKLALLIVAGACTALAACGGAHGRARTAAADPVSAALGDMPEGAFSSAAAAVCKTSCSVPSASEATATCSMHVAAGLEPAMSSLRGCLTSMGAGEVDPVILATYGQGGELSNAMIDLGGVQATGCIDRARALLPERTADASGLLRCSQRCATTN